MGLKVNPPNRLQVPHEQRLYLVWFIIDSSLTLSTLPVSSWALGIYLLIEGGKERKEKGKEAERGVKEKGRDSG